MQRANSVLNKVKQPSESEAKTPSSLFPSSRKCPDQPSFDPSAECIALPWQKKKDATKGKVATVRVVLLKSFSNVVPKGKSRQQLLCKGRIKPVKLQRQMAPLQVKNSLLQAFQEFNLQSFVLLDTMECGHNLIKSEEQNINGEWAIKKRGCIYLCEKYEERKNAFHKWLL